MPPDNDRDPNVLEAIKWFVRLRDEKATEEDRRAFEDWLEQSPAHRDAWERANDLWDRFDLAGPKIAARRRKISRRTLLGAGAIALFTAGGAYRFTHPELGADYRTGPGERRTVMLPDRTEVELGSLSALSVRYDNAVRRVELLAGEAFFDTARDVDRPFIVTAANGHTQALGTRFDVKYFQGEVIVAVADKAVLVRSGDAAPVQVERGFQVNYSKDGVGKPTKADLEAVEAWRRNVLMFQDRPLAHVLAELERYRRGRIFLVDRHLGDIPVTGVFNTQQADAALQTIADTLHLRLLFATDYIVFIHAAR